MTRFLYIFIDESGNPSSGEYYVVAGNWCVSRRSNPRQVLQSATDKLTAIAESSRHSSHSISELKGSQLSPDVISAIIACFDDDPLYSDPSLEYQNLPWPISLPIRLTIHDLHPDLGIEALTDLFGESPELSAGSPTHPTALQTLSLASVLNPLFQSGRVDLEHIDAVKVVLDADVWADPATRIDACLGVVSNPPEQLDFETRDSKSTPGLQIADLAAYTWGRYLREGEQQESISLLDNLRLADT